MYGRYSTASQGKVLSIPGLMKFHMLQGATTDIWQRKDRGGRRVLCICIVLDLTPSQRLDDEFLCSVLALLSALQRMQYHVQLVAYLPRSFRTRAPPFRVQT